MPPPTRARRGARGPRGSVDRALVPIENSLEGSVERDARRARVRGHGRRDRRRGRPSGAPLPDRRASRLELAERPHGRLAPAGERPVRALPARALPRRARSCPPPRPPSGARGRRGGERRRPRRSAPRSRPSSTAARSCATASRTSPATRPASSGSPASATPRRRRATAPQDRARVLGRRLAAPGWLVRCLSEFAVRGVNLTRIESGRSGAASASTCSSLDLEGSSTTQRSPTAVEDCVRTPMSCVSSGRFRRPERRAGLMATLPLQR